VTDSHYLLSTSTSDFEGIETFVYTFDKSSIIDLSPLPDTAFSQIEAYQYTSENESPSTLHAASALELPDGTSLGANATFLEASIDSSSKPKIFSQTALNTSSSFDGSTPLLIHQYDTFVPFTYPGTIEGDSESDAGTSSASVSLKLTAPVQAEVKATVFEFLQSSNSLNQNDFNHNGAFGIWSPNEWASVRALGSGGLSSLPNFIDSQDFRGYRIKNVLSTGLIFGAGAVNFEKIFYNGVLRVQGNSSNLCTLQVFALNPGPPDPIGGKWVTDINLAPFASLSDGTTLYKKTIIVTDVIPAAVENDVPY
jgi:hypothetical protein